MIKNESIRFDCIDEASGLFIADLLMCRLDELDTFRFWQEVFTLQFPPTSNTGFQTIFTDDLRSVYFITDIVTTAIADTIQVGLQFILYNGSYHYGLLDNHFSTSSPPSVMTNNSYQRTYGVKNIICRGMNASCFQFFSSSDVPPYLLINYYKISRK